MKTSQPETLDRLLQGAGLRRDSQLAELLGVSPQAVSQARRKGRIPDGWVLKVADQFGLSTDWIFFGRGAGPTLPADSSDAATENPAPRTTPSPVAAKKSLSERLREENEQRLLIAQRLLEYGADPLSDPDKIGEPLLNYVVYALFNDNDEEDFWNYRSRFLILLVAFGAKSKYCIPRIVGKFDKTNMKQYEFFMVPEENGKYSGVITDGQGNDVAYI